ncbi:hypothetical protein [Luteimonas sp. 3794]|uniref:hypothetical protein n=1 Tax=Luteimonas sp. 3794 TaxID=2817730 RepID=UPI00285B3EA7|nr:hypothetical protein [Luteimonas sp. 3794]MDR6993293.1 hypothetical protein [Luteimonas sp. 3794]
MGAFYTNVTVRSSSLEEVLSYLSGRAAFVSPEWNGYITIYDEQCDEGGLYPNEFSSDISRHLSTVAFLVTVHDDDILYFDVFENGERRDEYDSCPNYFSEDGEDVPPEGGNPEVLCALFNCKDIAAVRHTLYVDDEESDICIFATERHRVLAEQLRLPSFSVGYGYKYLATGEAPNGLSADKLIHTASGA